MKDEIKEILDYFRKYMCIEDCIKLSKIEDCIINLQDTLKDREEYCYGLETQITNLQQRCEYLERSNNRREDEIMSLRDEINSYEDYESRFEKAIEYIGNGNLGVPRNTRNKFIKILKVSDKE